MYGKISEVWIFQEISINCSPSFFLHIVFPKRGLGRNFSNSKVLWQKFPRLSPLRSFLWNQFMGDFFRVNFQRSFLIREFLRKFNLEAWIFWGIVSEAWVSKGDPEFLGYSYVALIFKNIFLNPGFLRIFLKWFFTDFFGGFDNREFFETSTFKEFFLGVGL